MSSPHVFVPMRGRRRQLEFASPGGDYRVVQDNQHPRPRLQVLGAHALVWLAGRKVGLIVAPGHHALGVTAPAVMFAARRYRTAQTKAQTKHFPSKEQALAWLLGLPLEGVRFMANRTN